MRHKSLVFGLLLVTALPGCGKKPKPVAPAPPPDVVRQEDDYTRFKNMTVEELDRLGLLQDIHFDYDRFDIREGDRQILSKNAEALKKFDFIRITVEGHCD